jgi:hypothetical protein
VIVVVANLLFKMMISFKSNPEMFEKEKSGKKSNTIRNRDNYVELSVGLGHYFDMVKIINTKTKESFIRKITDYSEWDGYCIISWSSV